MEQFIKNADQLNIDKIKSLAAEKKLRERLKPNDTFYIPNPDLSQIESLLKGDKVEYKKTAHPTYNLTLFTVLN
ncbi:MAG TPA: hypothetical protein VNB90_01415 [Cytophagaceae bacterium]|jgi:hypothetical protein|nr:hypothetical protein [Cytophagaceae bacterium]